MKDGLGRTKATSDDTLRREAMTEITTITVGSRRIAIHSMSGEVMDSRKWTTTEVSGGGGSGVISHGSGYVQQDEVKSKTTTHDQIIIRAADGEEESLKVEDLNLAVRQGHWVSLIWAIPSGRKEGPFVAILNHNTKSLDFIGSGVNKACFSMISSVLGVATFFLALIGAFVCFVSSVILGVLLMVPCAAYFFWLRKRRGEFTDQVLALREQIKTLQAAPPVPAVSP
jgi:hypothetical protein